MHHNVSNFYRFAIGVPVDDDSSPPECHAAYSAGNPFKAAVTASVVRCLFS